MDKKFKKIAPYLTIFIVTFFLCGSYIIYKNEVENIENSVYNRLNHSLYYFKEYFSISESFLYAMKYTLEDKLRLKANCSHPSYIDLVQDENHYYIKDKRCSLIGLKNSNDFSQELTNELNSALYLKSVFYAAKKIIPDLHRIYYKSSNNFIFLSPAFEQKIDKTFFSKFDNNFSKEFQNEKKEYENNILKKPFLDFESKEKLINLFLEVHDNTAFKGIVAIDINLNSLNKFLDKIKLKGNIYLIDKNNQIITAREVPTKNEKLDSTNSNIIKLPIVENQLYLAYLIKHDKLKYEAFYKGSGKILILSLLLIISVMSIYLKTLLMKMEYLAKTDSLTGLLNRRAMQEAIESQINISRRYNQEFSFLLIDIDFFKNVNDTYGHQVGDKVLIEVSNLFKHLIRNSDIAARFGGEEFLLALSNTEVDEAFIMAERVRKLVNEIKIKNTKINLTVSIGCCALKKSDDYDSIIKRVDKLMYKAKSEGRNKTAKEED